MSGLLPQAARRIGGSVLRRTQAALTSPAVAKERPRLGPRLMHTEQDHPIQYFTANRIAEGKKSLKDLSDQVIPTPDGFDWRQVPFADLGKGVAAICNGVIKGGLLIAVVSECPPFRKYHL